MPRTLQPHPQKGEKMGVINLSPKQIQHLQQNRTLTVIGKVRPKNGVVITGRPKWANDTTDDLFWFNIISTIGKHQGATCAPIIPLHDKNELLSVREDGRKVLVVHEDDLQNGEMFRSEYSGWQYRADMTMVFEDDYHLSDDDPPKDTIFDKKWTPAKSMPEKFSRYILRVKAVQVLQLSDISDADARSAGYSSAEEAVREWLRNGHRACDGNSWVFLYKLELPIAT